MQNIIKKTFGWTFIVIGLVVIFFTIFDSMSYFKAEKEFPEIFQKQEKIVENNQSDTTSASMDQLMKDLISSQMDNMLPSGTLEKTLNMIACYLFAFLLIFAGSKISEIGFKLVKD